MEIIRPLIDRVDVYPGNKLSRCEVDIVGA